LLAYELSLLADLALMIPLTCAVAVSVGRVDRRLVGRWLTALAVCAVLVGISKISWALLHYRIGNLPFRMISGHMLLACALWPLVLGMMGASLAGPAGGRRVGLAPGMAAVSAAGSSGALSVAAGISGWAWAGRIAGYGMCVVIAVARLRGAHTLLEVLAGALLGVGIDIYFWSRLVVVQPMFRSRFTFTLIVLAVFILCYGRMTPDVDWINYWAWRIRR